MNCSVQTKLFYVFLMHSRFSPHHAQARAQKPDHVPCNCIKYRNLLWLTTHAYSHIYILVNTNIYTGNCFILCSNIVHAPHKYESLYLIRRPSTKVKKSFLELCYAFTQKIFLCYFHQQTRFSVGSNYTSLLASSPTSPIHKTHS